MTDVKVLVPVADGSEDIECWWYLADAENDTWVITQLALIDCQEHGL